MRLGTKIKQPLEYKDYNIDYSPWLSPINDTLGNVDAIVIECLTDPEDESLTIDPDTVGMTTNAIKIWVAGGTNGNRYKVTLRVSTVIGRIDESEIIFNIRDF